MENNINKLDKDFINLAREDSLDISVLEELLVKKYK